MNSNRTIRRIHSFRRQHTRLNAGVQSWISNGSNSRTTSNQRSIQGSNMVEGVVGIMVVILGLIAAGLLLMNSGVLIYNQEKIGFVAESAAAFAATRTDPATRQADVDAEVTDLMNNLGLGAATTTNKIKDITVNSKPAVSLTVTANLPTMLTSGFGNLLPQQVQLTETAVSLKPINTMKYLVVIHPLGGMITLPLVAPTGVLPKDGLPAWEISLAGVRRLR